MSCDSAGLPNTRIAVAPCESGSNEAAPSQKDLEKWAELVAACGAQAAQPVPPPSIPTSMPEAWRADVEALTPDLTQSEASQTAHAVLAQNVGPTSSSSSENELNRIQVRLNAGDLGELSLVVERSLDGLRVQIGAENNALLATMAKQSAAMAQSIASAGQPVTSLTFVAMDGLGINLARAREGSGNEAQGEPAMNSDENPIENRRRKNRQVNVLG